MEPLISVCVISYNSESTVLETLESIRKQEYKNIELIISDDGSKDKTIEIVQEWLNRNNSRFVSYKFLKAEKNKGITGNINHACKNATGDYIKPIGADDILLPTYCSDCIDFLCKNPKVEALFTRVQFFPDDVKEKPDVNYDYFNLSVTEQYEYIKYKIPQICTPSEIYKADLLKRMNYFDERIPMWEDAPFYHKLASNNVKLYLLDKVELLNRVREDSISHKPSISHKKSVALYYRLYLKNDDFKCNLWKGVLHYTRFSLMLHCDKKIPAILLGLINFIRKEDI